MIPKLTLLIVLLVFALADAGDTNIHVTSTTRLKPSDEPLTTAALEVPVAHPALNEVCNSSIINNTECYPFVITVKTGENSYVGPNARVYIIMYGLDNKKNVEANSGKIWLEGGVKDEKNNTDLFNVKVDKMISPVSKIEIGIVNSVVGLGLFLDSVTIYSPTTKIEQYFPHHQWFVIHEGNTVTQRTLYEQISLRKERAADFFSEVTLQVLVWTSDITGAGTDANVYIQLSGHKGTSDAIQLDDEKDNFERGGLDIFYITTQDLGNIFQSRIFHDNSGSDPGWHLNKIEFVVGNRLYTFNINRWLATDEGDKKISFNWPWFE